MSTIIAAFDFDGTLTYHDSLLPFLRFMKKDIATTCHLITEIPAFIQYEMGLLSRQDIKERLLTDFLAGISYHFAFEKGKEFAKYKIPSLLKPNALKSLSWHRSQGHCCVLVSANIDLYLDPWAKITGFDHVICSCCEVNAGGYLTGRLIGKNCWGPEKSRRLFELLGDQITLYAYGDSRGDKDLLSIADYSFYRTV